MPSRSTISIPLSELLQNGRLEIYRQVEERGYFSLHFRGKELQLVAGPYVGLIPICPGVTINVQPRLPVANLARILEFSREALRAINEVDRTYAWFGEATPSILEFLLRSLLASLETVEIHGLDKQYTRVESVSGTPRGRIDLQATFRRLIARGIDQKIVTRRFEQTLNTPANRLIKAALYEGTQRLARSGAATASVIRDLNRMLLRFESVPLDITGSLVIAKATVDVRTNLSARSYYAEAVKVASAILSGKGIALDRQGTDFEMASFILNFEDVFESYLRQALAKALWNSSRGSFAVLNGNDKANSRPVFDDAASPSAQPDIIIRRGDCCVLAEIKYKDSTNRENLNQLIGYTASYRAKAGILVHLAPKGQSSGIKRVGRIEETEYFTFPFNLSSDHLQAEEAVLARAVEELCAARVSNSSVPGSVAN